MDYGHTAQNGQVSPQFGAMPQNANMMSNGQMQAMPGVSAQAAQSFGANTMNAYTPVPNMPQEQMQYQGQPISQASMQQPVMSYDQQMMQPMMQPQEQMVQPMMQPQMAQPQMAQSRVEQPQVQTQSTQMSAGNALESLKQGVDLNGGISPSDVAKMDAAIQLLDQMGPADFYEQFSTVAETTVGNNYGVKVDS